MSIRVGGHAVSRLIRSSSSSSSSSSFRLPSILHSKHGYDEDDSETFTIESKQLQDRTGKDIPEFPRGESWKNPLSLTREEDERFIYAATLVWWDMDANPLPPSADASALLRAIKNGLSWAGYNGPIALFGYGDKDKMPCQVWNQLLNNAGAHISHVPSLNGDKDSIFSRILLDMGMSTTEYPSPSNHLLISSDMRYKAGLEELQTYGYNFLLSRSSTKPTIALETIAFKIWNWEDLVEGGLPLIHQQSTQLERPVGRSTFATSAKEYILNNDLSKVLFC